MSLNSAFLCPILSLGIAQGDLFFEAQQPHFAQGILTVSAKDWGTSAEKSIRILDADDTVGWWKKSGLHSPVEMVNGVVLFTGFLSCFIHARWLGMGFLNHQQYGQIIVKSLVMTT